MRDLTAREAMIKKFEKDQSISIFLLSTKVGGVGLTLTAADRVVICKFYQIKSSVLLNINHALAM